MIRRLRTKFIIITMVSVTLVLAVIITLINVVSYFNTAGDADDTIAIIAEHGGDMPSSGDLFKYDEALYTTRFFSVSLSEDGEVIYTNTKYVSAVDYTTAVSYATELYQSGKTSGYYGNYRYAAMNASISFLRPDNSVSYIVDNTTLYIFLDWTEQLEAFNSFLWASILISVTGLILIFLMVFFLSNMAVKPMAESYKKQKRFITDASHEIKTPLTIIDANTEVLEMTEGENEWTESIRKQVKRLTAMTENLVFLSRMDENAGNIQKTDFSLSDAVEEAADPFKTLALARGKTLTLNVAGGVTYNGNEAEIRKLVSVLLDNAVKYSSENGYIELNLRTSAKGKEITVKNSVADITAGKHDELFERFYRSDKSHNSETGGHGIGLSIAMAVVENHNGKITARSDDGKSLTITAVL